MVRLISRTTTHHVFDWQRPFVGTIPLFVRDSHFRLRIAESPLVVAGPCSVLEELFGRLRPVAEIILEPALRGFLLFRRRPRLAFLPCRAAVLLLERDAGLLAPLNPSHAL